MSTALFSLFDKTDSRRYAHELRKRGFTEFIASESTAKHLLGEPYSGPPVVDVDSSVPGVIRISDTVGDPILGHKVVTIHRETAARILADDSPEDQAELARLGLKPIDLVWVTLYPLAAEIVKPGATEMSVIRQTDIGGPLLLREGAKGRRLPICRPDQLQRVLDWLDTGRPDEANFRRRLAAEAEAYVAQYGLMSAIYNGQGQFAGVIGERVYDFVYGENRWQTANGKVASLYTNGTDYPLAPSKFTLVGGGAPSYNNVLDEDRLVHILAHIAAAFEENRGYVPYMAVAGKHGNPCGAGVAKTPKHALQKAIEGDTLAIFGGVLMVNFPIDGELAETIRTHKMKDGRRLLDCVCAPSFTPEAIEVLERKGGKCRMLVNPALGNLSANSIDITPRMRFLSGGEFAVQPNYTFVLNLSHPDLQRSAQATVQQEEDMLLAWALGSMSNSNTICIVKDGRLLGLGCGQQDRVGAADLACRRAGRAGHRRALRRAVAYSDSFFPETDAPEVLAKAGVEVIFTSRGSVRDKAVRQTCLNLGVMLYTLPDEVCRGFAWH